ncbi:MAG: transferrin-binding protein-like solute binding protein [Boseongicola sp. SB0673_bin_14]|nr:transferrin-binding protein-like solute binding protein [Boseongicola sp. SB0667_bin_21]MYI68106.1 transferrin-binding protein-like solute binding protein [Boseongicola sp. SB0673_bin_14]
MRFPAIFGLAAATGLSLAACGESSVPPVLGPDDIRELTGLSVPIETGTAQQQRQQGIIARADSLIISTTHVEVMLPEGTRSFRILAECSGSQCQTLDPVTGETDTRGLDAVALAFGDAEAIGSAHGITLVSESAQHMGVAGTSFGAWMEHGAFTLNTERAIGEEIESSFVYAIAAGDLTDLPLAGSATWLGIMTGTPVVGDGEGDRLVGTAALNYDMSVGGLDAAFSGIWNIDRGTAHPVEALIFSDIAVGPNGTFATGQSGTRIQGGFHGPGHAEVAGVFEQSGVVGAFGAIRQ